MLYLCIIILQLFVLPNILAAEVHIDFLGDTPNNIMLNYDIRSGNNSIKGTVLSDNITFNLDKEFYDIVLSHDDLSTPGYDLFGSISANIKDSTNLKIMMLPVGSLKINVVDKRNNKLKKTIVKIDCSKNYGNQGYYYTDEFGSINIDYLPVANCNAKSAIEDFISEVQVNISVGSKSEITIKFNEYSSKPNYIILIVIAAAVFIILVHFIIMGIRKQKKPSIKKEIVSALDSKEQKIVNFLIDEIEKSPNGYVNQNKIVYGTGIAKTSLSRILGSLERKGIITVEKIGKLKKISFTDSFSKK